MFLTRLLSPFVFVAPQTPSKELHHQSRMTEDKHLQGWACEVGLSGKLLFTKVVQLALRALHFPSKYNAGHINYLFTGTKYRLSFTANE